MSHRALEVADRRDCFWPNQPVLGYAPAAISLTPVIEEELDEGDIVSTIDAGRTN
jgi:hypothetical protein